MQSCDAVGRAYVFLGYRTDNRHNVNDRHKRSPDARPDINVRTRLPQMERPALEAMPKQLTEDWNTVRPVQRNSRKVEDRRDGRIRAQTNQIDEHTAEAEEPNRIQRGVRQRADFIPDMRAGQHLVAGKCPNGAGAGLDGGHGREVEDEEGGDGEEDAATFADDVIEDLGDGLGDGGGEDGGWIAHGVGKDDGEEPAADPGEAQRGGNGPWGFDGWVLDLLCDVRGGVVVGHGPGSGEKAEEERPSCWTPTGGRDYGGPDVAAAVFVLLHDQQRDTAAEKNCQMPHDVCLGDLLQGARFQAVEYGVQGSDGGHDAHSVAVCR